jgi:hypothetical protein
MAMFTMRYIFKPNASTALFAAFVREKIESAETLFAQPSDRSRLTLPDHGLIEGLLRENSTGKMLVVIVMVNLQKSLEVVGELLPKRAVLIADCLAW